MIRHVRDKVTSSSANDFGTRLSIRRRGISYSLEAAARFRDASEQTPIADLQNGRLLGGVTYGFNRATLVNLSIGKNFKNDFSNGGTFVASIGITIGLGELGLDSVNR